MLIIATNVHDLTHAAELLHGDEEVVDAIELYHSIAKTPELAKSSVKCRIAMRPAKAALNQTHWRAN